MARVDATGIHTRSLAEYRSLLEDRFRESLGADLDLAPETPQGQIIGIVALALTEADEAVVQTGQALDVVTAIGVQLDDLGSLLQIARDPATRSTATITVTGTVGTQIPAGSRVQNEAGAVFETTAAAVIATGGTDIAVRALETGPVAAAAGSLTEIVTLVPGWETSTNASPAEPGRAVQSDADYRQIYRSRTALRAAGPADGLRAALIDAGARDVRVVENATSGRVTTQGFPVEPHSVIAVVEGGSDTDLVEAITRHAGMGVGLMTARYGGAHSTLTALQAITNGSIVVGGETFSGINLSGAANLAAVATTITTALHTSTTDRIDRTHVTYPTPPATGAGFRLSFPWAESGPLTVADSALATALGLTDALATPSPGPFVRPRIRDLVVTAAVTVSARFPSDGLARLRARAGTVVLLLGIGDQARVNDLVVALDGLVGTTITSLTVTDGGTTVDSAVVPLEGKYRLPASGLNITLTTA